MSATHKNITLITSNEGKVREFERLLDATLDHEKVDLPEIQNTDVKEVARKKAEEAYKLLGRACLVDDTGLTIHAWGELPGAYIRSFLDNVGNEGIVKMIAPDVARSATVTTALGYCDENGPRVFSGEVRGTIAEAPIGENGFGYDAIFIPEGQDKTFAQMTNEEKDQFSMRARAAQTMLKEL
jgi:non-canonical purine NTP pyrophosphatase (RdgB/HAM1 family)